MPTPTERAKHDPFASRVPDHSVVHRYARCLSYPEWGVGTVAGIYFSGNPDDEEVQQWARGSATAWTVPGGEALVDFPSPGRPAEERRVLCSGRACGSATACARCRRGACGSWTSQSPTPPRSASSAS